MYVFFIIFKGKESASWYKNFPCVVIHNICSVAVVYMCMLSGFYRIPVTFQFFWCTHYFITSCHAIQQQMTKNLFLNSNHSTTPTYVIALG